LQQTPSAQCSEAHSASRVQTEPFILGPQLASRHFRPLTQSTSLAQRLKHWLVAGSQEKGTQTVVAASLQPFAPSHVKVPTMESPSHVPGLQTVPAT
jgi:hypothetical protein